MLFICCLVVAAYFAYSAASGWYQNLQLADQQAESERRLAALQEKRDYLKAVQAYAETDEFVEQQARRELGLIYPGETAFIVESPPLPSERIVAGDWWERLFPR